MNQPAVSDKAAQCPLEITVPICHFRVRIFPQARLLISLGGKVDMKIVKGLTFNLVCVLMALPVIPTQSEDLG
jgi:hypothetical protein